MLLDIKATSSLIWALSWSSDLSSDNALAITLVMSQGRVPHKACIFKYRFYKWVILMQQIVKIECITVKCITVKKLDATDPQVCFRTDWVHMSAPVQIIISANTEQLKNDNTDCMSTAPRYTGSILIASDMPKYYSTTKRRWQQINKGRHDIAATFFVIKKLAGNKQRLSKRRNSTASTADRFPVHRPPAKPRS